MKKLLILLIAACGSASAFAQEPNSHDQPDYLVSRWVIDANLMGGLSTQTFTTASTMGNYPNALNMNTGQLKYTNGTSYGGDAQLGFFFGKMRHFGIGAGFMYMGQHGDANLNNYHVEYQATDGNGNIYRQVVNGNNIQETVNSTNLNIPLVLKYKTRFSKHWGFSTDAGALINVQMKNAYSTNASFNYEAIYKLEQTGDGGTVSVYDNSPVASANDWFVTKAEFLQNNPNGNYQNYVNTERAAGINVGEGITPDNRKGNTSYTAGSIGLLVQPSINYYLSDYVALNLGVYYMVQPFKNNAQSNYTLTDGLGTYSSVLNSVTASTNQAYGIDIGARFFFRKKGRTPMTISSIDQVSPTLCGLCDGSMALHGLPPDEPVTVDYSLNGGPLTRSSTTVAADGKVTITHLCAGNYTGIVATIRNRNAIGQTVTLADPQVSIIAVNATNPTVIGTCDGTISIKTVNTGQNVTVNYTLNGTPQPVYNAMVGTDNTIRLTALCEGTYNGFKVTTANNCSATWSGSNMVLTAPVPPPPPPPPVEEAIDINTPILFDFNKSSIHISSYPLLNEASKELREENDLYIRVDAYTDAIGSAAYNQKLSIRRADAVRAYLKSKGVNTAKVKVYGHGKTDPVASNDTEEGRSKNRRAVMEKVPARK